MVPAAGVGMVMVGRAWPAPSGARRSRQVSDASLMDDLLGPASYWTTIPHPAPGGIRQAFHDCHTCQQTTAGVVARDSWPCAQCFTPTPTAIHTTTGD